MMSPSNLGSQPTAQGQFEEGSAGRPGSKTNFEDAPENSVHVKKEEAPSSDTQSKLDSVERAQSGKAHDEEPSSATEKPTKQSALSTTDNTTIEQPDVQEGATVTASLLERPPQSQAGQSTNAPQVADASAIKLEPQQ